MLHIMLTVVHCNYLTISFNKFNNDNLFFRETNESNLLLKEKAESLQNKIQRADQRITDLTRVEIENEVCKQAGKVHPIQMISCHVICKFLTFLTFQKSNWN